MDEKSVRFPLWLRDRTLFYWPHHLISIGNYLVLLDKPRVLLDKVRLLLDEIWILMDKITILLDKNAFLMDNNPSYWTKNTFNGQVTILLDNSRNLSYFN